MIFDVFGKRILEVIRVDNEWQAFYCGNEGKKRKANDIQIPASLNEKEIEVYIADIFHEWSTSMDSKVKRL